MDRKELNRRFILLYKYLLQSVNSKSRDENKNVLFVAGNQRSGTNMVMDILERSFETDVYHETDKRAFDEYLMRNKEEITRLIERSKASLVVIKALCESQDIPELLNSHSNSKAIWVIRRYDDVVKSMNVSFPKHRVHMINIGKNRDIGKWRTSRMTDETYQEIRPFLTDDLNSPTAAAIQWYFRNKLYMERKMYEDDRIRLMFYEDAVVRPAQTFNSVCKFADIGFEQFMAKNVHSRSVRDVKAEGIDMKVRDMCDRLFQEFKQLPHEKVTR